MFGKHKPWKADGWIWYGKTDVSPHGKFQIANTQERIDELFEKLQPAVDAGHILVLKKPEHTADESILQVFVTTPHREEVERILATNHVLFPPWTADTRSAEEKSRHLGEHFSTEERKTVKAQKELFKSLLEFWCHLLRAQGVYKPLIGEVEAKEDSVTISATLEKKVSFFRYETVATLVYAFTVDQNGNRDDTPGNIGLLCPDVSMRHALQHAIFESRHELQSLNAQTHEVHNLGQAA